MGKKFKTIEYLTNSKIPYGEVKKINDVDKVFAKEMKDFKSKFKVTEGCSLKVPENDILVLQELFNIPSAKFKSINENISKLLKNSKVKQN